MPSLDDKWMSVIKLTLLTVIIGLCLAFGYQNGFDMGKDTITLLIYVLAGGGLEGLQSILKGPK